MVFAYLDPGQSSVIFQAAIAGAIAAVLIAAVVVLVVRSNRTRKSLRCPRCGGPVAPSDLFCASCGLARPDA